jgi:hypothetical protein
VKISAARNPNIAALSKSPPSEDFEAAQKVDRGWKNGYNLSKAAGQAFLTPTPRAAIHKHPKALSLMSVSISLQFPMIHISFLCPSSRPFGVLELTIVKIARLVVAREVLSKSENKQSKIHLNYIESYITRDLAPETAPDENCIAIP